MTNYLTSKTVAILGGGQVGSTLAKAILDSGKAKMVVIAARDPEKTKTKLLEQGIDSMSVEESSSAIASADVIILATPSLHSDEEILKVAQSMGDVAGKIIIDSTNPVSEFQDGLQIRWKQGTSGGEVFQGALPSAFVYKAFNTIGVEHMSCAEGKDMFFCGSSEDDESLETVREVVSAVGFNPIYVGPIRYARNLEAMAELWIHCAIPPLPGANLGREWSFAAARSPLS
jgi:8-hydroxy-5-deazaflavin:NADPH oxidoreductase